MEKGYLWGSTRITAFQTLFYYFLFCNISSHRACSLVLIMLKGIQTVQFGHAGCAGRGCTFPKTQQITFEQLQSCGRLKEQEGEVQRRDICPGETLVWPDHDVPFVPSDTTASAVLPVPTERQLMGNSYAEMWKSFLQTYTEVCSSSPNRRHVVKPLQTASALEGQAIPNLFKMSSVL